MSWPLVELGKVCEINVGKTPSRHNSEYWGEGKKWLSIKDMSQGALLTNTKETITQKAIQETNIKLVKKGTVLFSFKLSIGKIGVAQSDMYTNEAIAALPIIDKSILCEEYLVYALSRWEQGIKSHRAVMGAALNKAKLLKLKIPLPPLDEQEHIAAILDKADTIRRKRQQAIKLADDFLRSVFLDMFGDPVTNPKGWKVKSMKNLIKIQGGYAFKSGDFGKVGIPVVKIGNANKLGFTTKGVAFIEPENPSSLKKYELYAGDLLMSLTGTVGKDDYANVTEVTNEYKMYYLNQRVAKITVDESEISKNYLKFFLAEPQIKGEITKNNRGVRQANIGNADIYGLNVPVPSHSALNLFDSIVKQVKEMSFKTAEAPECSESLFNSLSQKAFAGEL